MTKLDKIVISIFVGCILLGARACSDCEKFKAAAVATCQATGEESQACLAAIKLAEEKCKDEPVTCPDRCPVGQQCTDPILGCQPIPPSCPEQCPAGQVCKDPAVGCVQQTCEDLACQYGCDESGEFPVCKPKPPTTCDPACKADEKCVARGSVEIVYECVKIPGPPDPALIPDESLTVVPGDMKAQMWGQVEAAIERHKALHKELWNAEQTCLSNGASGIDNAFLGFAIELARVDITAGQSITQGGKRSDALFVNRPGTQLYEEWHLFDYARGCVATGTNAMKGVYRRGEGPPPPPPGDCPYEPCPSREWTEQTLPDGWDPALIGQPAYFMQWHKHTMGNNDSTPINQRQCDFCASIGMGEINGTQRCSCPVRPDGHSERPEMEAWLLYGGFTRDSRNGQDCTPNNTDNPAAWLAGTGNCRMCNAPKSVCTEWD